jgi:hypothetical protein
MNERIKELCIKSGAWDHYEVNEGVDGDEVPMQEFAELIVKECMRMCEVAQVGYLTHGLEKEASGAYSVKQYIEEYLGVEG